MAVDIASLQRQHPEWRIVDAIVAPNGGIWALGSDGGVFALNSQGGTDGVTAPYFQSYTTLDPAARQGDRTFNKITVDPATGGYILTSNFNEQYRFVGDKPLQQAVDPAATPAPTTGTEFTDADKRNLEADLRSLGLGDLLEQAWAYYKDPQGGAGDAKATLRYLEDTPTYKEHFPGLAELREQGRAWTPGQWTDYYNRLQEAAVSYGLPAGMIDRADVGKMVTGNVSLTEALGRIQAAGESVYNADPSVIAKMREFGFTDGDLTAFYLDPDRAAPLLERKAQEEQARISVAGAQGGYNIDLGEATQLQKWGVDEAEAQQGFAQLSDYHPLFANTAGETTIGEDITESEQLAATFGNDSGARQEIERRLKSRQSSFQGGGGAATGGSGKTGLG